MSTVLTIGDVDFDAAEVEECSFTPSARRASNSGYHRMGKPNWWARVGDTFMQIGRVRADNDCPNIDVAEIVAALGEQRRAELIVGYGKHGHRDAERESFTIVRHAEAEAAEDIQLSGWYPLTDVGGDSTLGSTGNPSAPSEPIGHRQSKRNRRSRTRNRTSEPMPSIEVRDE